MIIVSVVLLAPLITAKHHSCAWHPWKVLEKHPHLQIRETSKVTPSFAVEEELPKAWDWRNVDGVSYVTRTLNQHIPQYCGSCWAHAAVSTFSDRLKIMRNATWPEIQLSVQYPLNCLTHAGTCNGGSDLLLFEELQKEGAPDDTCESYVAKDQKCTLRNRCRNCFGPPGSGHCFAQPVYLKYRAKDYGFLRNINGPEIQASVDNLPAMVRAMKREIYRRGPISCVVDAEPMFNYTGGVFAEPGIEVNHVVAVSGWGVEDDVEYWIVRNSWGTYWGEDGWIRIKTTVNASFIESFCSWVEPDWPPVQVEEKPSSQEETCERHCGQQEDPAVCFDHCSSSPQFAMS
eukprot:Protomagalhaensia_wolfi_Nauph_80__6356@NODE_99_length_3727_cov_66_058026_g75_i0_p2_GENE_NODE_99_length_3727_cov_66_058026_g75_i0NODE_99_length_3727_cov_66_058026_g75_i0_p2_ORF_typecomplete_len345_score44_17Peptidase_C1/PF00112_23/2_7e45Peptidase_C1_2/PF03051_15/0_00059_NODE_99_length_3727_cov_66_058026_g75_i0671101